MGLLSRWGILKTKKMKTRFTLFIYFLIFFLLPGKNLNAQADVLGYIDFGQTSVSNGLYIKTAGLGSYQFEKNKIETGFQLDLKSNNKNIISGYSINASRELLIKNFPFEVEGFFIWTPFSNILRETNWGILLNIKSDHFVMRVGTNFRTFSYTQKAIEAYELESNT